MSNASPSPDLNGDTTDNSTDDDHGTATAPHPFGVALAEALASGLPAVSTACGGPEDIISEDVGRTVETGDSEQLAAKITEVAQRLPDMAEAARERAVAKYSTDAVLTQYEQLYRRLA